MSKYITTTATSSAMINELTGVISTPVVAINATTARSAIELPTSHVLGRDCQK